MNEPIQDLDIVYDVRRETQILSTLYQKIYNLIERYNIIENIFSSTFQDINQLYYILKGTSKLDIIAKQILIRSYNFTSLEDLKVQFHKTNNNYKLFQKYTDYIIRTFNKQHRIAYILTCISLGYSFKDYYNKFESFIIEIRNYIEEEKELFQLMTENSYDDIKELFKNPEKIIDTSTLYKELVYELEKFCKILAFNFDLYTNYYYIAKNSFN